ncbi:MAG: 5-(carboxyamino)imidazole ribonucleotide synthase, partial [Anaerolineaceae bacterium]
MFAIAARRMGYRVHTFSPEFDTPTGQVSDLEITADYADLDRVAEFARGVSVVTFEFENVPAATADACERFAPVRPSGHVLHIAQHRLREKTFLASAGLPVTPFRAVRSAEDLREALTGLGCPAILKTAGFGYDGKGQQRVSSFSQVDEAVHNLHGSDAVLEAFIDFEREVSVVAARGLDGSFVHYGVLENEHCRHILDTTIAPARVSEAVQREAIHITRTVFDELDVNGVLCVEFFLTRSGKLLINELAPRPHNSGHWSFDAAMTSQFE